MASRVPRPAAVLALVLLAAVALARAAPQQGGGTAPRQDWGWPSLQQNGLQEQQPELVPVQQQQSTTPAPADGVLVVLPAACACTAPEQYNPVCGSDGNTYQNRQKLDCFARCGSNVQYRRMGVCRRRQDVPT